MKTAIELADRLSHGYPSTERKEAAAMLIQQAEQIEKLGDDLLAASVAYSAEIESLKADAERYQFAREKFMCYREENNDDATRRHGSELVVYAAELHIDLPRVYSTYGGVHQYKVDPKVVDAAIDAMKGKS